MQQLTLWDGIAARKLRGQVVCRKTGRTQSRRNDWEDFHEPEFYGGVAVPYVTPDVYDNILAGVLEDLTDTQHKAVTMAIEKFHEPIVLPLGLDDETHRLILNTIYRLRHASQMRMCMEGDKAIREPDYPEALEGICRAFQEEVLAQRGLRSAAHGISRVDPKDPSKGFRCQAWGEIGGKTVQGIRVGHIHIGYAKDEETAYRLVAAWWLKNRRIDISVCYHPDSAIAQLASMMRDAAINQGNAREYAEMTATEVFGDDED
jgi:hypothetical protein